jgi:RNA polymerase sigma-70 factor (ECF subfamily)
VDSGAPDDAILVAQSRRGDLAAFNELVERHQARVFNLALRLVGTREAAEDVTQDSFIAAFRKLDQFAGDNFISWLLRIAANNAKDELRRRARRPASSIDVIFGTGPGDLEPRAEGVSVEEWAERGELGRILWQALQELPEEQRMPIVLVDVEGFAYGEVAGMLGWSTGTVKSRISRGRARLRELLGSRPELLEGFWRLED